MIELGGGGDSGKVVLTVEGVDSSRAIISSCGSCKYLKRFRIHYVSQHDRFDFVQLGELSCNLGCETTVDRCAASLPLQLCMSVLGEYSTAISENLANTVCTKLWKTADSDLQNSVCFQMGTMVHICFLHLCSFFCLFFHCTSIQIYLLPAFNAAV